MLHKTLQRIRRHKRIRSRIYGSSSKPRLSVFRSNMHIYAQLIDDEKNNTIVSVSDIDADVKNIKKEEVLLDGFNKVNRAFLVGKLLAKKAVEKKITTIVFDRGGFLYSGRVRAVADGARKGGLIF